MHVEHLFEVLERLDEAVAVEHGFGGHGHAPDGVSCVFKRAHTVVAEVDLVERVAGGVSLHVLVMSYETGVDLVDGKDRIFDILPTFF